MTKCGICQDGYPKLIVYGSDTLVAITVDQATLVNLMENQAVKYRDLSDSLKSNSNVKDVKLFKLESILELLKQERIIQEEGKRDCERLMADFNELLEKERRKSKRIGVIAKIAVSVAIIELVIIALISQ